MYKHKLKTKKQLQNINKHMKNTQKTYKNKQQRTKKTLNNYFKII